jgi:hypothetical protein
MLVQTTKGLMPEAALRRVDTFEDHDEHENPHTVTAVEYYDGDELVHRSASVHIKNPLTLTSALEAF